MIPRSTNDPNYIDVVRGGRSLHKIGPLTALRRRLSDVSAPVVHISIHRLVRPVSGHVLRVEGQRKAPIAESASMARSCSRSGLRCLGRLLDSRGPYGLDQTPGGSSGRRGSASTIRGKEAHHGEIVTVGQALEVVAEQGGKDARVQLVEQAGEVKGGLDAR